MSNTFSGHKTANTEFEPEWWLRDSISGGMGKLGFKVNDRIPGSLLYTQISKTCSFKTIIFACRLYSCFAVFAPAIIEYRAGFYVPEYVKFRRGAVAQATGRANTNVWGGWRCGHLSLTVHKAAWAATNMLRMEVGRIDVCPHSITSAMPFLRWRLAAGAGTLHTQEYRRYKSTSMIWKEAALTSDRKRECMGTSFKLGVPLTSGYDGFGCNEIH